MSLSVEFPWNLVDAQRSVCQSELLIESGGQPFDDYCDAAERVVRDRANRAIRLQVAGGILGGFAIGTDNKKARVLALLVGAGLFFKGKWDQETVNFGWRDLWNKQRGRHAGSLGFRDRFNLSPEASTILEYWMN
jgi:hypothetical protein